MNLDPNAEYYVLYQNEEETHRVSGIEKARELRDYLIEQYGSAVIKDLEFREVQ